MIRYCFMSILSLTTFTQGLKHSVCDDDCVHTPLFSPSELVVMYGDPVSARCSPCQHCSQNTEAHLEVSIGKKRRDGNSVLWKVDRMTHWNTSAKCVQIIDGQVCCDHLHVTLYQPPDNVCISLTNHTESMLKGHGYTLHCKVKRVAPVKNLTVQFYKGKTAISEQQHYDDTKTPVTKIFTQQIIPNEVDSAGQYWCGAKLALDSIGRYTFSASQRLNETMNGCDRPRILVTAKASMFRYGGIVGWMNGWAVVIYGIILCFMHSLT
ncbi:intercellular adhesion molecule 4-like [Pholidichthys leucotaenia]